MRTKPWEQLTWNGKWARWTRHRKKCKICTEETPCPDCPPNYSRRAVAGYRRPVSKRTASHSLHKALAYYCWWCGILLAKPITCDECGTPFDKEKSEQVAKRRSKGYMEYFKESAVREGKDVKEAVLRLNKAKRLLGY